MLGIAREILQMELLRVSHCEDEVYHRQRVAAAAAAAAAALC